MRHKPRPVQASKGWHVLDAKERFNPEGDYAMQAPPAQSEGVVRFERGSMRRHRLWILAITAFFVIVGSAFALLRTKTYTSEASVVIDNKQLQLTNQDAVYARSAVDVPMVQNQVELLRSESIARRVVENLKLYEQDDFKMPAPGLVARLIVIPLVDALQTAEVGNYKVPEVTGDPKDFEQQAKVQYAILTLQKNLLVRRIGESYTLEVSVSTRNPQLSAKVTNEIVATFMNDQIQQNIQAATAASGWLRDRIRSMGANARVISEAVPPLRPSGPTNSLIVALSGLVGLLIGIAIAYARDATDPKVRTAEQLAALTGAECFGMIRDVGRSVPRPRPGAAQGDAPPGEFTVPPFFRLGAELQLSVISQTLQRTAAALRERSGRSQVVGITSVLPGEGRSTVAANLAFLMAMGGHRVMLIDACPYNKTLSRILAPGASKGIETVLAETDVKSLGKRLEEAVLTDPVSGLYFLPSVKPEDSHNTAFGRSNHTADVLKLALKMVDFVILDVPPLQPVSDVRLVGPLLDALVLTAQWGATPRNRVASSLDTAGMSGARLVGSILNRVKQDEIQYMMTRDISRKGRKHMKDFASESIRDRSPALKAPRSPAPVAKPQTAKKAASLLAIALLALGLLAPANKVLAADKPPATETGAYLLATGDRLRLRVHEWPDLSGEFAVGSNGMISLPVIGPVMANHKSTDEVAASIAELLQQRGRSEGTPSVSVEVALFRPFFILGDVMKPGDYPFRPGTTVLQAISIAGGYYRGQDPGLLRLERDAILNRGEASVFAMRLLALQAREARLQAERTRAATVSFPEVLVERADDPIVKKMMTEQQQTLIANLRALTEQIQTHEQVIELYKQEIKSLEGQISTQVDEGKAVGKEIEEVRGMVARNLAPLPRLTVLERTYAQIVGNQRALETLIVRAQQQITLTNQLIKQAEAVYRDRVNREIELTINEMGEVSRRVQTSRRLVQEAEVIAPAQALERLQQQSTETRFTITRRIGLETKTFPAEGGTSIEPGDVLNVERSTPMPSAVSAGGDGLATRIR